MNIKDLEVKSKISGRRLYKVSSSTEVVYVMNELAKEYPDRTVIISIDSLNHVGIISGCKDVCMDDDTIYISNFSTDALKEPQDYGIKLSELVNTVNELVESHKSNDYNIKIELYTMIGRSLDIIASNNILYVDPGTSGHQHVIFSNSSCF